MTQQVLAEHVAAREALEALREVRSVVDVSIYVWLPKAGRRRSLTLAERKVLWEASRRSG